MTSCLDCAKGDYISSAGQAACDPCPAGSFTDFEGSAVCSDCPGPACRRFFFFELSAFLKKGKNGVRRKPIRGYHQ
jgi:hypothetical protein